MSHSHLVNQNLQPKTLNHKMDTLSGIVPFTVEKESVEHQMKLYYKGKTLLPKEFKRDNLIEEIQNGHTSF